MTGVARLPRIQALSGTSPGPRLALLGGIHGDEFEGVLAVRRLMTVLRGTSFRGSLISAAPAHPAAWEDSSRTSPIDGLNLARVFPGTTRGTATEQVAAHLTAEVIADSDLLIDLHSAGRNYDMPLLTGFHSAGPLAQYARDAARAFNAPFLWHHPDAAAGRSLAAAEPLGVPSFYVEARGGGRIRSGDVHAYVSGLLRVMVFLGMVAADAAVVSRHVRPWDHTTEVIGEGNTDEGITSPATGYFMTAVETGTYMKHGDEIGTVVDPDGVPTAVVRAPSDGVVMLLTRSARVRPGDTLAIVAGLFDDEETRRDDR